MALWYDCGSGMLPTKGFARSRSPLTVLFCCPGPSLSAVRDEDLHMPGVLVAAINTAYPHVRPDIWAGLDKPSAYDPRLWSEPFTKILRAGYQDLHCTVGRVAECANTYFGDPERRVSADLILDRREHDVKFIMSGGTFTFMLHLLIWQGYRNIYLVGCDFGGSTDYHDSRVLDGKERSHNRQLYGQIATWLPAFAAKARHRGIEITSATRDSPINGRMPYEALPDVLVRLSSFAQGIDARVLHCKKAEVCHWLHAKPNGREGIIVGCDRWQENLLPGWHHRLRSHDRRPILFCDFGMSQSMIEWCRRRGRYEPMTQAREHLAGWWLKPAAILASPFSRSLWLDVDCEVCGSLDAVFSSLAEADVCMRPSAYPISSPKALPAHVQTYNSGVLCVRHGAPVIEQWARRVMLDREKFCGDQDVLSQVLHESGMSPSPLSGDANWFVRSGKRPDAFIRHWTGPNGKKALAQQWSQRLIFVHIKEGNTGDAACCPAHYVEFGRPYQIVDWQEVTDAWMEAHGSADIIIGGGGLVSDAAKLEILSRPGGLRIAWGIGRAGKGNVEYGSFACSLHLFDLCGVRDLDTPFECVPCPSCLHPGLTHPTKPTHEVVVYNHQHHPFDKMGDAPRMDNRTPDAARAIRFLASGATVVTSSYHGALWAMWLGRKVLIQRPWSVKFYTFGKKPGVALGRDWRKSVARAVDFSGDGFLEAARSRTAAFHHMVMERLDSRGTIYGLPSAASVTPVAEMSLPLA